MKHDQHIGFLSKRLNFLSLLCFGVFFPGCDTLSQHRTKYPKNIEIYQTSTESSRLSSLLTVNKTVKLESNKESFISAIDKVIVVNDNIFVLDATAGKLLIFNIEGKFIKRLGKSGGGSGECYSTLGMTLNYNSNEVLIACREKRSILRYDVSGKFLGEIRIEGGLDKIAYLGNSRLAISNGYYSETNENLNIIDSDGIQVGSGFEFPKETPTMLFGSVGILSETKGGALYADPLSSEIYQVTSSGDISLKYRLDFGSMQWPEDKKHDWLSFMRHKIGTKSILLNKAFETDDVFIFSYQDGKYLRTGTYQKNSTGFTLTKTYLRTLLRIHL